MNLPELFGQLGNAPPWLIWTLAILGILLIGRMIVAGRPARSWASGAYFRGVVSRIPPNKHLLTYHGHGQC